jgi:hypothetical protein
LANEQKVEKKEKEEKPVVSAEWCDDEIKLLVKGVKIIPVGTRDRYATQKNPIKGGVIFPKFKLLGLFYKDGK